MNLPLLKPALIETASIQTASIQTASIQTAPIQTGPIDSATTSEVVQNLRQQIRKIETLPRNQHGAAISTGSTELDQLLPEQGLARGTVTCWHQSSGGCGGEILSLIAARNACHHSNTQQRTAAKNGAQQRALVIIDPAQHFYPPAAVMWGINLKQTIVIRCPAKSISKTLDSNTLDSKTLWAIQQALQCPAVGAVWGCLPTLNERWSRRFQLATEQHGTMAMFVHPASRTAQPNWAEVQWLIELRHARTQPSSHSRLIRLKLQRVRGGRAGATAAVEIDFTTGNLKAVQTTNAVIPEPNHVPAQQHETHTLYLASQLADPKTRRRIQRA